MVNRSPVRVGVLGSVELAVHDQPVAISRVQVRRLLSILSARTHLQTSTDVLVDMLWPDRLPSDPRAALAVVVSRLRASLGDARDCLVTSADGIRLTAVVDAVEFEELLAKARAADDPRTAIALLEVALGLWRGRPFPDFDQLGVLRSVVTSLDEVRWSAVTLLVEARAEVGDHAGVAATGLAFHEEDPQRELLAAAVARSLAYEGRKAEALDVLQRTRVALRDGLGLDPSTVITDLEAAILHGSVELRAARSVAEVRSARMFVGRRDELDKLVTSWPGMRAVVGEPGVGKSALLREASMAAAERGSVVVSGAASRTPERPMEGMAEVLERLIERTPPDPDEQLLVAALGRVVPSMIPAGPAIHALTRDVLIESIAAYVERSSPIDEVVIVIDDCQWLDPLSARVLERLVRSARCNVIGGTRPDPKPHLAWLTDGSLATLRTIELTAFGEEEIRELIAGEFGEHAGRVDAQRILERSGGNALFAAMLIELIAEGGDAERGLPSTVLVAVQQRFEALSSRARDTLQIAATIGSSFSLSIVRQLAPTADADLMEAVGANLVNLDSHADTGSFIHVLVAEGAYELLSEGRRVLLHDQVGELLSASGAFAAEYAHHFSEAASLDPHRAATAHHEAALTAAYAYGWEDVEAHALSGLEHLGAGGGRLKAQLAVLLGRAQRFLHRDHPDEALLEGASIARELDDDELFADAVIALSVQSWSAAGAVNPSAAALFEEALTLDLPPTKRAQLCAAGSTFVMSDRHERAREIYHEALDLALTLDDPTVQAEVLRYSRWGLIHPDDLATLSEVTILLADLAGHDAEFRWGAATNRFAIGTINGDRAMVDRAIVGLRAMHATFGPSPRDWEMAHIETGYAVFTGDLEGIDDRLDRVLEIGLATTSREWFVPIYAASLVGVRRAQGRLGEILPMVDQAMADGASYLGWNAVAAAAAVAAGDLNRAAIELDLTAADDFRALVPDATWSAVTALVTDAIVALHDRERATAMMSLLVPYAGRMTWSGVTTLGPIDDSLARLSVVLGDDDAAAEHRRAAEEMSSRIVGQRVG